MSGSISTSSRRKCHDRAFHAFGTGYVMETRARSLLFWRNAKILLEVLTPVVLGYVLITFDEGGEYNAVFGVIAGIVGCFSLILTVLGAAFAWDAKWVSYIESKKQNYKFAGQLTELGNSTSIGPRKHEEEFRVLAAKLGVRDDIDHEFNLSQLEKNTGYRAAARHYQRECTGCRQIPVSMTLSDCSVCGRGR